MGDNFNTLYPTLAFFAWELARWQEVIDWAVGVAGAITLIAMNVARLRRYVINCRNGEKQSGDNLQG